MNTSFKWFLDILAGVGRNQRGVEQVWFGKVDVGLTKLYLVDVGLTRLVHVSSAQWPGKL